MANCLKCEIDDRTSRTVATIPIRNHLWIKATEAATIAKCQAAVRR